MINSVIIFFNKRRKLYQPISISFFNYRFFLKITYFSYTLSAILGVLSVYLETRCIFLLFNKFWQEQLKQIDALLPSILLGFHFDVLIISEHSSDFVLPYLLFKGEHRVFFEKLLMVTEIYLNPSFVIWMHDEILL